MINRHFLWQESCGIVSNCIFISLLFCLTVLYALSLFASSVDSCYAYCHSFNMLHSHLHSLFSDLTAELFQLMPHILLDLFTIKWL